MKWGWLHCLFGNHDWKEFSARKVSDETDVGNSILWEPEHWEIQQYCSRCNAERDIII